MTIKKSDISAPTPISVPRVNQGDSPIRLKHASVSSPDIPNMPASLTLRQYSALIQGLVSFKRQILALSSAAQSLVRELQEVVDVTVPDMAELNFLTDSIQLLCNTFTNWGPGVEREVEIPILQDFKELTSSGKSIQDNNSKKLSALMGMLQKEEDVSYQLGKKKQRDFETLQSSLNRRVVISNEISRLQKENENLMDDLTAERANKVLSIVINGIRPELEAFAMIHEGLTKLSIELDIKGNPLTDGDFSHIPADDLNGQLMATVIKDNF
jgi:hypothetical protein